MENDHQKFVGKDIEVQEEEEQADGSNDNSDESIDMLAQARILDPESVARREREFDRDVRMAGNGLSGQDSAASVDGDGRYSTASDSSTDGSDEF